MYMKGSAVAPPRYEARSLAGTLNSRDTRDLRGRIQANRRSRSPLTRHPRHNNPPAHHHGHDRGSHHHHHGPPHHPREGGRGGGGGHHGGHHGGGNPRDISPRRESKADPSRPGILTFDQIREQQRREKERRRGEEEERRRRAREYERQKEEDRRRREEEQKRRLFYCPPKSPHTYYFFQINFEIMASFSVQLTRSFSHLLTPTKSYFLARSL